MNGAFRVLCSALVLLTATVSVAQQAPQTRLVTQAEIQEGLTPDGSRWLTFGGGYHNQRHSPLTQITPENVHRLAAQWTFQTNEVEKFETTPLLRDNVLYVTGPLNTAWAIDARSGRTFWEYRRELPENLTACCGLVNRGFAMLGDRLYMTTLDAHVLAFDSATGRIVWEAEMAEHSVGYAATIAPIAVNDKIIVGVAGGEYGIRGFIDAYDAQTGELAWRFYTIPGPGEPGNETWAGDSWRTGGASVWVTGAFDPAHNLLYYGIGNPGPDYHSESRLGDNLYSDSIVALDADTGELRWHYQFTPHDVHDWDATEVPILADIEMDGELREVVLFANRNGFYYTLDRVTGELLVAEPFVHTTWAKEIGVDGRPVLLPGTHTRRGRRDHVSGPQGRDEFLAAEFRSGDGGVLRQRPRRVHDLLRLGTGVHTRPALHRRRRRIHPGRPRHAALRRAARPGSDLGRAFVGVPLSHAFRGGAADDRKRHHLQR